MNVSTPTARAFYFGEKEHDESDQAALERSFFSSIKLRNGTYKLTYHHRLDDLNVTVNSLLPPECPLKVMDVAVSSGITTAEWLDSLRKAGIDCQMTAGDLIVNTYLLSIGKHLHVLVDPTGHQMQYEVCGRAISTPIRRWNWLFFGLPLLFIMMVARAVFSRLRESCRIELPAKEVRAYGVRCRPVQLVSPSLKQYGNLKVIEDDLLATAEFREPFHVIRAANILNPTHFTKQQLTKMLINLKSRLICRGLLVVCRTNDKEVNNATVFTLVEDGRLVVRERLNDGSELEDLVLSISLEPSATAT